MIRNAVARVSAHLKRGSMSPRRRLRRKQPADIQSLEQRTLLTGNVLATFNAGVLSLKGDKLDNRIDVRETETGFEVVGVDTSVNGQASADFTGSIENLKATMKGGNDRVLVTADVIENVTAKMGSGADFFAILGSKIGGDTNLNLGSVKGVRSESAYIQNAILHGGVKIKGGGGVHFAEISNSQVIGPTSISLGGGEDFLSVRSSAFESAFNANGGGGNDTTQLFGADLPTKKFETHF